MTQNTKIEIGSELNFDPQKAQFSRIYTQLDIIGIWYFGKISKNKTIFPSLFPYGRGFRKIIRQKKHKLK